MKMSRFRITQVMQHISHECHSLEELVMSMFGGQEIPDHVQIEHVETVEDDPAPAKEEPAPVVQEQEPVKEEPAHELPADPAPTAEKMNGQDHQSAV